MGSAMKGITGIRFRPVPLNKPVKALIFNVLIGFFYYLLPILLPIK